VTASHSVVDLAVAVEQVVADIRSGQYESMSIAVDARQAPLVAGDAVTVRSLLSHLILHALQLTQGEPLLRVVLSRIGSSAVVEIKHGQVYPEVVVHRLQLPCVPTPRASGVLADSIPVESAVRRQNPPETVREPVASLHGGAVRQRDTLEMDELLGRSVTPWSPPNQQVADELSERSRRTIPERSVQVANFPRR
jgi:hypothetical protein